MPGEDRLGWEVSPGGGRGGLEACTDLHETGWWSELVNRDRCVDSTREVEFDRIWDPLVRGLRESLFRTLTEQENTGHMQV